MTKRLGFAALLGCCLAAAGCNGWPRAPELKQVENKPEKYPTYAATSAQQTQVITFDNRRFIVEPVAINLHEPKLQSVGNAGGFGIYAPNGEESPYSTLYTPAGGTRWRRVVPID